MIGRLMHSGGFKWFCKNSVYAKGYLFDRNNILYRNKKLVEYFDGITSETDFRELLKNANGFFSVIITINNITFAAVDRLRSMPLFFGWGGTELYISDDSLYLYKKLSQKPFNQSSCKEFLLTGYVTGNRTLSREIMQLRAGEYLVYDSTRAVALSRQYFKYSHYNILSEDEDMLIEKMDSMHLNVFKRLIKSLNGRTAVIPLSGGLDSRLIAIMFKRLGYTNVVCYSYGIYGNSESAVSKRIAESLGFKWIFIEYNRRKWHSFFNSNKRIRYFRYSGGIASLPHIQDWMAVEKIKRENLVPEDAVFIPGHSYDFIQGGHIPEGMADKDKFSSEDVVGYIFKRHYSLNSCDSEYLWNEFAYMVKGYIGKVSILSREEAANAFELWDWQERQAKFICNSVRAYEYFNFEWRLPLWDKEMMEFWLRIPFEKRVGRKLFLLYNDIYCSDYIVLEGRLRKTGLNVKEISSYDMKLLVRIVKNYMRIILNPIGIYNIGDIKKRVKHFEDLKNMYYNHPLAVFGIISFDEFIDEFKGKRNVNSIVVKRWLEELSNMQNIL